jgi:hypothetical protein
MTTDGRTNKWQGIPEKEEYDEKHKRHSKMISQASLNKESRLEVLLG